VISFAVNKDRQQSKEVQLRNRVDIDVVVKDKQLLLLGTQVGEQLYYRVKIFEIIIGILVISISIIIMNTIPKYEANCVVARDS
jgi:hypothetical protein